MLSALDTGQDIAFRIETGSQQGPAESATGIDRGGVSGLDEAAVPEVIAANHLAKSGIRLCQPGKSPDIPPKTVALRDQRPRRIDSGMDEEQLAVFTEGRASQCAHQSIVTRP